MRPFGSAERLASWIGCCPGHHERAGTRNSGKTRKSHAWVRRRLCEMAQAAARSHGAWRAKLMALTVRKGHKKSIVALAHKRLRSVYALLSRQLPYQDQTVDDAAQRVKRHAPRWIRMLVTHGCMPQVATTA